MKDLRDLVQHGARPRRSPRRSVGSGVFGDDGRRLALAFKDEPACSDVPPSCTAALLSEHPISPPLSPASSVTPSPRVRSELAFKDELACSDVRSHHLARLDAHESFRISEQLPQLPILELDLQRDQMY